MLSRLRSLCVLATSLIGLAQAQGLNLAIETASKLDPVLRSSELNQQANQEGVNVARSRLYPQVFMQGGGQQLTQTTTQDTATGPLARTFTGPSSSHQLMVRQALIRPREFSAVRQAQAMAQYSEYRMHIDRSDLWYRVSLAWVEWLGARELLKVQQAPLPTLKAWAQQERNRWAEGDGTRDSLMEAQAQWANAQALLAEAQQNNAAREAALRLLTHNTVPWGASVPWPQFLPAAPSFADSEGIWRRVLDDSLELKAAIAMEQIQSERQSMAKMEHMPTLDLVATANRALNDATSTQGYRYQNQQIGVQYTIPIFAGGGTMAAERQALAIFQASVADREALQMRLENEWLSVQSVVFAGPDRLNAGQEMLLSALEQCKAAERGMFHGVKTWSDRAQAELSFSRRSADQVNLMLGILRAQLRLLRLLPTTDPLWTQWIQSMQ